MGNINRQARMSRKKNRDLVLTQMFTQTARLFFLGIIFVAVIVIAALVFIRPTGNVDVDANVDASTRHV